MSQVSTVVSGAPQTVAKDKATPKGKGKGKTPNPKRAEKKAPVVKSTTKSKATTKSSKTAPKIDKATSKSKTTQPTAAHPATDRRASFYLSDEQTDKLKADYKATKVMPIPYSTGAYRSFLLALIDLGVNKSHPFKSVKDKMKALMSDKETVVDGRTQWQRFTGKEAHTDNEENALNVDGKIHQNAEVLQRVNGESNTPYGMKLLQVGRLILKSKGATVDILKSKDGREKLYRLNLNAAEPTNEFRTRRNNK